MTREERLARLEEQHTAAEIAAALLCKRMLRATDRFKARLYRCASLRKRIDRLWAAICAESTHECVRCGSLRETGEECQCLKEM
jgi:hypothetical protein